jgi:PII-like signaling protein
VITVQPVQVYFAGRATAAAPPPSPGQPRLSGACKLLRIYVNEHDRWRGRPLHEAIVESLRAHDIAGVTVYRGIAGYGPGAAGRSRGLPLMLSVVDTEERLRAYLPVLEGMMGTGLAALSEVEVIKYTHVFQEPSR